MNGMPVTEKNSEMMQWRVLMVPLDDFDQNVDPQMLVKACVREFRKRLEEEMRKGLLPCGYGPCAQP